MKLVFIWIFGCFDLLVFIVLWEIFWGVVVEIVNFGNGFYEYCLSGIDWGQLIFGNGFVIVGFNVS